MPTIECVTESIHVGNCAPGCCGPTWVNTPSQSKSDITIQIPNHVLRCCEQDFGCNTEGA